LWKSVREISLISYGQQFQFSQLSATGCISRTIHSIGEETAD
jgi:hypothetical protein